MIGRLTGKVLDCSPDRVLLDVTGVGYDVQIPLSTYYELAADAGATVSLHVHTHVREDVLSLFGFSSRDERTVFERLIAISGVGPRLALAILSGIGVDELREAVFRGDWARLQKIPGVGKKTAERVALELRDKLSAPESPHGDGVRASSGSYVGDSPARDDAISALINLGYRSPLAERAVAAAEDEEGPAASVEALLKGALRGLVR